MCINATAQPASAPRSARLCIPYALSSLTDGAFGCSCSHEHTLGPRECDEIEGLVDDLSYVLEERRRSAIATAAASAALTQAGTATTNGCPIAAGKRQATADRDADLVAELNERAEELQGCARHLDLYVRHMLRKALSHTITPTLLADLKANPERVHAIADYKAKPLPSGWRETQTAAFGKRGLSLHGVTALRWDMRRGDFAALNLRVVCDDSNQTWYHTLAALRTSLDMLTDVWPAAPAAHA